MRPAVDSLHVSESSAGRVLKSVAMTIIEVFSNKVQFPMGDMASKAKEGFRRIAGNHAGYFSMHSFEFVRRKMKVKF